MRIVNMTPHPVHIIDSDGGIAVTFEPHPDGPARVETVVEESAPVVLAEATVPMRSIRFGQVVGLPYPTPGVLYIVSAKVAEAMPRRRDLLVPHDIVRGEHGEVIGCMSLAYRDA